MPNMDDILSKGQAAGLLKDPGKLEQLRDAPETQKIFSMLRENTNGGLEQAADQAARGDTSQLLSAIRNVMKNPEGAKLMEKMKDYLK